MHDIEKFLSGGYTKEQMFEVIVIVSLKGVTNYLAQSIFFKVMFGKWWACGMLLLHWAIIVPR